MPLQSRYANMSNYKDVQICGEGAPLFNLVGFLELLRDASVSPRQLLPLPPTRLYQPWVIQKTKLTHLQSYSTSPLWKKSHVSVRWIFPLLSVWALHCIDSSYTVITIPAQYWEVDNKGKNSTIIQFLVWKKRKKSALRMLSNTAS